MMVYTREAHPGEKIGATNMEEKVSHARMLREHDNVNLRILVDDVGRRVHKKYDWVPNMVYVLNRGE